MTQSRQHDYKVRYRNVGRIPRRDVKRERERKRAPLIV